MVENAHRYGSYKRPGRATVLCILGVASVLLVAGGVAYQCIASAGESRLYPRTGDLVLVGNQRMHIHCEGDGSPAVILDAGLGDSSAVWGLVQPEVAKFTKVCAYDRAGLGWSEPAENPRTSNQIARELEVLLTRTPVQGPYVLVGHSFGGYNQRVFASHHRDKIVGMILVDAAQPDQNNEVSASVRIDYYVRRKVGILTILLGVRRILGWCADDYEFPNVPPAWARIAPTVIAQGCRFSRWWTRRAEMISFRESGDEAAAAGSLGNVPLVVLSHDPRTGTGFPPAPPNQAELRWDRMQEELTALSSNGKRVVAKNSMHYIQAYRPDLVVRAIQEVYNSAKSGKSIAAKMTYE
jgi:pimeloyl-ACP methyl ester carboxylesterase